MVMFSPDVLEAYARELIASRLAEARDEALAQRLATPSARSFGALGRHHLAAGLRAVARWLDPGLAEPGVLLASPGDGTPGVRVARPSAGTPGVLIARPR